MALPVYDNQVILAGTNMLTLKDVTMKAGYLWICIIKETLKTRGILIADCQIAARDSKNLMQSKMSIRHADMSVLNMLEGENGEVIDNNWIQSRMKYMGVDVREKNPLKGKVVQVETTGWVRVRMNPDKNAMKNGFKAVPVYKYDLKVPMKELHMPTLTRYGTVSPEFIDVINPFTNFGGFIVVPKSGKYAGMPVGMLEVPFTAMFDMRAFPDFFNHDVANRKDVVREASENRIAPQDMYIAREIMEIEALKTGKTVVDLNEASQHLAMKVAEKSAQKVIEKEEQKKQQKKAKGSSDTLFNLWKNLARSNSMRRK